jgi:hypothetical protein
VINQPLVWKRKAYVLDQCLDDCLDDCLGGGVSSQLKRALTTVALSTFVWLSTVLLSCCTTPGVKIQTNEQQSLNYIRFVINKTAPRGVRSASQNQREVLSNYFSVDDEALDTTTKRDRAYAHFLILGASRPYEVEVRVVTERRSGGEYKKIGIDKSHTKFLAKRLEEALAKSREDSNFVDDWRPF